MNQTSINKIRRSKNTRIKQKERRREKLSIQIFNVESTIIQFIQSLVEFIEAILNPNFVPKVLPRSLRSPPKNEAKLQYKD